MFFRDVPKAASVEAYWSAVKTPVRDVGHGRLRRMLPRYDVLGYMEARDKAMKRCFDCKRLKFNGGNCEGDKFRCREFQKRWGLYAETEITKNKKEKCVKCIYSRRNSETSGLMQNMTCSYITIRGHSRGKNPFECDKFEPRKKGEHDGTRAFRNS